MVRDTMNKLNRITKHVQITQKRKGKGKRITKIRGKKRNTNNKCHAQIQIYQ